MWRKGHFKCVSKLYHYRLACLLALPRRKRWLARLVANPYYFRFNTSLDLEINLRGVVDKKASGAAVTHA